MLKEPLSQRKLRLTTPLKPLRLLRTMEEVPEEPCVMLSDAGLVEMLKSAG